MIRYGRERAFRVEIDDGDPIYINCETGERHKAPPKPRHKEFKKARRDLQRLGQGMLRKYHERLSELEYKMLICQPIQSMGIFSASDVLDEFLYEQLNTAPYKYFVWRANYTHGRDPRLFMADGEGGLIDRKANSFEFRRKVTRFFITHPEEPELDNWREVMQDFEITQPFSQVDRYRGLDLSFLDRDRHFIKNFEMPSSALGRLPQHGWTKYLRGWTKWFCTLRPTWDNHRTDGIVRWELSSGLSAIEDAHQISLLEGTWNI